MLRQRRVLHERDEAVLRVVHRHQPPLAALRVEAVAGVAVERVREQRLAAGRVADDGLARRLRRERYGDQRGGCRDGSRRAECGALRCFMLESSSARLRNHVEQRRLAGAHARQRAFERRRERGGICDRALGIDAVALARSSRSRARGRG